MVMWPSSWAVLNAHRNASTAKKGLDSLVLTFFEICERVMNVLILKKFMSSILKICVNLQTSFTCSSSGISE
jgi:hypothetical protein